MYPGTESRKLSEMTGTQTNFDLGIYCLFKSRHFYTALKLYFKIYPSSTTLGKQSFYSHVGFIKNEIFPLMFVIQFHILLFL